MVPAPVPASLVVVIIVVGVSPEKSSETCWTFFFICSAPAPYLLPYLHRTYIVPASYLPRTCTVPVPRRASCLETWLAGWPVVSGTASWLVGWLAGSGSASGAGSDSDSGLVPVPVPVLAGWPAGWLARSGSGFRFWFRFCTCTVPAPYLHRTCTVPAPYLHRTCTVPAP